MRQQYRYFFCPLLVMMISFLSLVSCGSTPARTMQTTVHTNQTTTLDLGHGADLIIPPGAMPEGTKVQASFGTSPTNTDPEMKSLIAPIELTSNPANAIHSVLTLEFPVPAAPDGIDPQALYGISSYDSATKSWVPYVSTYDAARHKMVALIPHFSWWNPFSWDLGAVAQHINQTVGQLAGKRADEEAKCMSGPPPWVNPNPAGIDNSVAIPIRSCVQSQGGILDVEIVNNRPYGMLLQYGAPVKWGWHESGDSQLDKSFFSLGDALTGSNALYLPPLSKASIGIVPTAPNTDSYFKITPTLGTVFVDFLHAAADEAFDKIPDFGECLGLAMQFVASNKAADILSDLQDIGKCLQEVIEQAKSLILKADEKIVSEVEVLYSGLEAASIVGNVFDIWGRTWQIADLFNDMSAYNYSGPVGVGFSILSNPEKTPTSAPQPPSAPAPNTPMPQPPTATPISQPPSTPPTPTWTPVPPPTTYSEQEGHYGANTFTDPYNASGMGPNKIPAAAWVQVSCKVYAPAIASVNPDGYWYRISSSPWNNAYYAAANTFMNGDPWNGPYSHNTDFNVPNC